MNTHNRINPLKIQRLLSKSWISFPFFLMISIILYSFVVVKGDVTDAQGKIPDGKDSLMSNQQPKIDIKVNKKYDANGNLIQFDSSYSIVYSSPNANTHIQFFTFDNDSIFSQFKNKMDDNTLFNDDFFKDFQSFGFNQDMFQMNPIQQLKQMEEMMHSMMENHRGDSLIIDPSKQFKLQPKTQARPQPPQPKPLTQPKQQNSIPNMITL